MAKSADGEPAGRDQLPQHPYVEWLKPDPSQPAKRVVVLTGLPGNSDRPAYQRLYLSAKLDYYAEFLTSDMVHAEAVPANPSVLLGDEVTRVSIRRDATIHYIWARSAQPVDEFDLDIRLGAPGGILPARAIPTGATCIPEDTSCGTCDGTCQTCHGTCRACPEQATYQITCGNPHCASPAIDTPTAACVVLHPDYIPPRDDR